MHYLIIGGGIAGTTAAEELRKLDPSSDITIISEEQHPIHSRVLLPHYLKGKIPRNRVFLKKDGWYEEQRIEWMCGVQAVHLDPRNRHVGLSNGRELPYDKLLLATGGDVRTIDPDLRGVLYFRTLDDADHIQQILSEQKPGARAGIYGGGFISCEFLNLFAHAGIPTVLAHRSTHFWTGSLLDEAGELIEDHVRQHGVEVYPQTELKRLEGEKELAGFVSSHGVHPCTMLGVGIGIAPDFSWLRCADVAVHIGILANEYLETNVPDVYTAGDVSEFYDVIVQRRVNIGNWMNALMQGRTVAKTMAGERTRFELVSSYATNALGLEIIFVGDTLKAAAHHVQLVGSRAEGGITQLFERAGKLVGAVMIGRNRDRPVVTRDIQQTADITRTVDNLASS